MCGQFNRTGVLCGKCKFHLCGVSRWSNELVKVCIVLAGFVPLTFFYIFIMLFNINITSSHLRGVVLFSQVFSIPPMACIITLTIENQHEVLKSIEAVYPLYSFWNLDFFRSVIPDICLNASTMEALALVMLLLSILLF